MSKVSSIRAPGHSTEISKKLPPVELQPLHTATIMIHLAGALETLLTLKKCYLKKAHLWFDLTVHFSKKPSTFGIFGPLQTWTLCAAVINCLLRGTQLQMFTACFSFRDACLEIGSTKDFHSLTSVIPFVFLTDFHRQWDICFWVLSDSKFFQPEIWRRASWVPRVCHSLQTLWIVHFYTQINRENSFTVIGTPKHYSSFLPRWQIPIFTPLNALFPYFGTTYPLHVTAMITKQQTSLS